jgi:hypothetical protein
MHVHGTCHGHVPLPIMVMAAACRGAMTGANAIIQFDKEAQFLSMSNDLGFLRTRGLNANMLRILTAFVPSESVTVMC